MKHEYPVTDGFVEYHRGAGYDRMSTVWAASGSGAEYVNLPVLPFIIDQPARISAI